jgi:DNA-binding transcriptional LysR family regulator
MSWEGFDEAVAIADAGSFVGGAALLGTSTSHVSRVVARLEERLGTILFHRTTRRVVLTDTGAAFVERCRRLLDERDELLSEASGSSEPHGQLRVTCSIALGERFVAPIARRFTRAHAHVSLTLDLTNRVVDLISEGYDIGVRTRHVVDERLISRNIGQRPLELCAAPNYLALAGAPGRVDDLANHECLVGTSQTWQFLENGMAKLFNPKGRWRCNSGAAVVDAALAGMGICQVPSFYVRQHISSGRLVALLPERRAEPEPIWVVYPQRRHLLPKIQGLVQALEAQLQLSIDEELASSHNLTG